MFKTLSGIVVGAVIAIGTMAAWPAEAVPGDSDATFTPIAPCRLLDTRPDTRVGAHGAFGEGETKTLIGRGQTGACVIPSDAIGLSLNVTAVGATGQSFLTFWPSGGRPTASSLNPAPGEPPTPNAVTALVNEADGTFLVYNHSGSVDVIIDVVGYYTRSSLREIQARLVALEGGQVPPSASGFSARITGYGPSFSITSVSGDVTNGTGTTLDVRADVHCPNGTVETDVIFDVPPGQTRGFEVLCDGVFTSGASVTTVLI